MPIIIRRAKAHADKWTFRIPAVKQLIARYVGDGHNWVDPFAGMASMAEITNDLNPNCNAKYHMEAIDFCNSLSSAYDGVLFDPPYSYRQISDCYSGIGLKATQQDTQAYFYNKVMNSICDKIKLGGYAISCGWNSQGFGKARGFKCIEILLVCHMGHSNDTIITVEIKTHSPLKMELEEAHCV